MSQAQFVIPLIQPVPGQLITAQLWINEFLNLQTNLNPSGVGGYSDTDTQMQIQTAPYPGSVTSHASNVAGELERLRYQLAQAFGTSYWYQPPAISLAAAQNSLVPIGAVIDFPSATPPNSNFLLANGQAIGRSAYAALFALISTTFGVGDGTTTFNLPNYTDIMSIGAGNLYALAATGGAVSQVLAKNQIPSSLLTLNDPGHVHTASSTDSGHTHSVTDPGHTHTEKGGTTGGTGNHVLSGPTSGGTESNTSSPTASGTTGISGTNSGTANISTTVNSHSTGITLTDNGGSTAVPTLPPYLGMYKMIRVL